MHKYLAHSFIELLIKNTSILKCCQLKEKYFIKSRKSRFLKKIEIKIRYLKIGKPVMIPPLMSRNGGSIQINGMIKDLQSNINPKQ